MLSTNDVANRVQSFLDRGGILFADTVLWSAVDPRLPVVCSDDEVLVPVEPECCEDCAPEPKAFLVSLSGTTAGSTVSVQIGEIICSFYKNGDGSWVST